MTEYPEIPQLPPVSGQEPTKATKKPPVEVKPAPKWDGQLYGSLSLMAEAQLLDMRQRIDDLLPTRSLKSLNMEQELVVQLQIVQKLQDEVMDDTDTPANQRAQVANSVASTMQTLAKLQVELYDSERLKKIEACLILAVDNLPQEAQVLFFAEYERSLGVTSHG